MNARTAALAPLLVVAFAATLHAQPASSAPATDPRPRLAIVGLHPAADADPRDAWIPTAIEELITWRLRRCTDLATSPSQRLYQGRLELTSPDGDDPGWDRVALALGATHLVTGECRGEARQVTLALNITQLDARTPPTLIDIRSAHLWDALDQATSAIVKHFAITCGEDDRFLRARPTESLSALEFFARAVAASRKNDALTAVRMARDAVDVDSRFRPALGLHAQLELKTAADGRTRATRALRTILDLAKSDHDDYDRLNAELALSLIARGENAPQAAVTRAQTALELSVRLNDIYGRIAVTSWLADLFLVNSDAAEQSTTQPTAARNADLRESLRWQNELATLIDAVGDRITAIPAATKRALTYERLGEDAAALDAYKRTLDLAAALQSKPHEASAWVYLAQYHRTRQQWSESRDAAMQALERVDDSGKPGALIMLGSILAGMGDSTQALATYQQAHEIVRSSTDLMRQLTCLREIARLRHATGDIQGAVKTMQEAVDLANILEAPDVESLRTQLDTWRAAAGRG